MKRTKIYFSVLILILSGSCNKFLDEEPISTITPEMYFTEESHFSAYSINLYSTFTNASENNQIPSKAMYDVNTDNQITRFASESFFAPGQYRVPQTGGDWDFTEIRSCNYFFDYALPKYEAGNVSGNSDNIRHYIGEVYFMRAYAYFKKLQLLGDFPIVETSLTDDKEILIEASKRMPRNEVARFILSDLELAKQYMKPTSIDGAKNRLSAPCAQLFASRVALYEASWLKYFKGTAYVPNGPGWPGSDKNYNANYNFPSGSIDAEIEYFLTISMENAKQVADAFALVTNTGVLQQSASQAKNPYYELFADVNMAEYSEVLLWRRFDRGQNVVNGYVGELRGGQIGLTRGFIDTYLMSNGLPIYATGSGYHGDDYIADVRKDRDSRLYLFLKEPGQLNILYPYDGGSTDSYPVEPIPDIIGGGDHRYQTGYAPRKGLNFDAAVAATNANTAGELIFRATEAYLNYIEACYERNGSLNADATNYWKKIRDRAHVDNDLDKTIAATDMSAEAKNDWGAYSGGNLIDKTLYNIRRERRCELISEGFRRMDLRRWRAMDQLIVTPYHLEGFKLWGPMRDWYNPSTLTYNVGASSTVSDPALSDYFRPYQKTSNFIYYNGLKWAMAHYLSPIAIQHFLITAENNVISSSPIYQNPNWPTEANQGAIQ
ncbi:RagB/SusD family nutrient uptake outer membrane protein [Olivibacter sitiensis]|uniref:RagB/SusD family nutrient uptake outer membrane protein n=1 Tax=Olivibacter sitiensis TaxID=376470 RepID=UPI00047F91AD|nr:RagB/SusD family nutrient uptake outer membrane protein [Olivibacter sitiensis]